MEISDELNSEVRKAEDERKVGEAMLENGKKKFADHILNTGVRQELENCNAYAVNNTYRLKLPAKVRLWRFLDKMKKVFGNGTE